MFSPACMAACLLPQGYPAGFPVLLPNRLSQQRSATVMQYLLDGNYLDRSTRRSTAELLTFNAELHVLGYTSASFEWQPDGAIKGVAVLKGNLHVHIVELPSICCCCVSAGSHVWVTVPCQNMLCTFS